MSFSKKEIFIAIDDLKTSKKKKDDNFHLFNHQANLSWFMNQGTKDQLTKNKKQQLNFLGATIYFLYNNTQENIELLTRANLQELYKNVKSNSDIMTFLDEPELISYLRDVLYATPILSKDEVQVALKILCTIILAFKKESIQSLEQ